MTPSSIPHGCVLAQVDACEDLLQQRNKWTDQQRNIQRGDIVIVMTDCAQRNAWPLGRVMETYKGNDGLV